MKVKVVIVGDRDVGKSSLIRRFVVDAFDDKYIQTVGSKVSKTHLSVAHPVATGDLEIEMTILRGPGAHDAPALIVPGAPFVVATAVKWPVARVSTPKRLPSLTGSIDALLFIEVLQHIPEPIIDDLLPQLLTALKPEGRLFVLGNRELDVDATGALAPDSRSIQEVLEHHLRIERQDLWTEGFAKPRHSFLCSVAAQGGAPKADAGG